MFFIFLVFFCCSYKHERNLVDVGVGSQCVDTSYVPPKKTYKSISVQTSPQRINNDLIISEKQNHKSLSTDFDIFDNVDENDIKNEENYEINNIFDSNVNSDLGNLISISQIPRQIINGNDDNSNDTNTVINENVFANINKIALCQREFDPFKRPNDVNSTKSSDISLNNNENLISINKNSNLDETFFNKSSKSNDNIESNSKCDISVNEIENSEPIENNTKMKGLFSKFKHYNAGDSKNVNNDNNKMSVEQQKETLQVSKLI